MMKQSKTYVISDTHFSHKGVCVFTKADGSKLRPWDDPDEMDEAMVSYWNDIVNPEDRVLHLGDLVINRRGLNVVRRLNGRIRLIMGNHDIFKKEDYLNAGIDDLKGYEVRNGLIFSHIPVHPNQLERFGTNVHGHTHSNRVMDNKFIDIRYHCVCVEQTNFRPILLDELYERITSEGGVVGFNNGNR